jgi:hypothetical protein
MKWFRVYLGKIEPVEVIRETEHFVIVTNPYYRKEERVKKYGGNWGGNYFRTFATARQYLIDHYQTLYDVACNELTRLAGKLREAGALQEPK